MNGRLEKEHEIALKTYNIMYDLPDFVEEWYDKMEASSRSASTRFDSVYKVKKYLEFVKPDPRSITVDDLTYKTVYNYMSFIKQKKTKNGDTVATSGSYQKTVWFALNSFFSFLVKRKYINENPMEEIDISRKKDTTRVNRNRKYLTLDDFNRIVLAVSKNKDKKRAARDKAVLLIFMSTGIRRRALSQIDIDDIDFDKGILTVIDKEDAERDCPLPPKTIEAIKDWMKYRDKSEETNALFLSVHNNRISEKEIYNMVKKYSEEGLGYSISPHKLRAGFCTILYNETKDIRFVQETVGHSSINTTQKYTVVDHSKEQNVVNLFNNIA